MGFFDKTPKDDLTDDISHSDWNDYETPGIQKYRNFLTKQFGKSGRDVGQIYRNTAANSIGAQQAEANRMGGQALQGSFGLNTPTGLTAALQRRSALQGDYAGANLAAKEASRRTKLQMGQALEGSQQSQANWYNGAISPWLQEQGMLSQLAAGESAADAQKDSEDMSNLISLIGLGAMVF